MPKVLFGPPPAIRARAQELADEVHEAVFQAVIFDGREFIWTFVQMAAAASLRWRDTEEREIAELADQYVCRTLDLRARVDAARKNPRLINR